jgi:hypothetical protein
MGDRSYSTGSLGRLTEVPRRKSIGSESQMALTLSALIWFSSAKTPAFSKNAPTDTSYGTVGACRCRNFTTSSRRWRLLRSTRSRRCFRPLAILKACFLPQRSGAVHRQSPLCSLPMSFLQA